MYQTLILILVTLISCAFSGETDEDFLQTINLIKEYKLPQVHISQFYPRPGLRSDNLILNATINIILRMKSN